jgi:hypothetical protein
VTDLIKINLGLRREIPVSKVTDLKEKYMRK